MINHSDLIIALHLAFPFQPAKGHELLGDEEILPPAIEKILSAGDVEKTRYAARERGIDIIEYGTDSYPISLLDLPDPPLVLYRQGSLAAFPTPSIAIVGTRQASLYGNATARQFAKMCAEQGIPVISGLARGIDTAAHEGALDGGYTMAIIGSGHAHIYPKENLTLAKQIMGRGALLSEYPIFTPPDRFQFPRRNRLIAALASGVLLIEAPIKSGAMTTLDWAARLKKICFALPGRIDMDTFRGNHHLIKEGKANLVENGEEMISLLSPGTFRQTQKIDSVTELTPAEHELLRKFPPHEVSFDELALSTRMPVHVLNALLMGLRIKNIIREYPGKMFKKVV